MLLKRKLSVGTLMLEGNEFGGCFTYEINRNRIGIGKLDLEHNQFIVKKDAEEVFDAEVLFFVQELTSIFLETLFEDENRPNIVWPAYYPSAAEERYILSHFSQYFPCMSSFFDRITFACDNPYVEDMKKEFEKFYKEQKGKLEASAGIKRLDDKNALRSRVLESCYQTDHPSYHFQIHPNDGFLNMIMKNSNKEESR